MKNVVLISMLGLSLGACKEESKTESGASNSKAVSNYMWQVCDGCGEPESAYYDPESEFIFVSNIIGEGNKKDAKGNVQKLHKSGKVLHSQWVSGLNAPKGMRSHKGILWVSDIDEMLAIDIKTAKILKKIPVNGAIFLNDVAISDDGTVYVSDTLGSTIYQIKNDRVSTFAKGKELESPNGLLVMGDQLVVAAWGLTTDWSTEVPGRLYSMDLNTKKMTYITKEPIGNLDGLEVFTKGRFLVSDWVAGKVMVVTAGGSTSTVLEGFQGSADIAYIKDTSTVVIPRMKENTISAHSLKKHAGE